MEKNKINIKEFKELYIQKMTSIGFNKYSPVSLLSEAFPTNFTPSGGEEHLNSILSQSSPKESFCTIQSCFRYQDIDNIETGFHSPIFEMGVAISVNEISIETMIDQFLTLFDYYNLDRNKLRISIFKGGSVLDKELLFDQSNAEIWKKKGIMENQFLYLGSDENYFVLKEQGYAGLKTEAFYEYNNQFIEIAVFIKLTHSVNENYANGFCLGSFDDEVTCFGIGIERWMIIINNLKSIFFLEENIYYYQLLCAEVNKALDYNQAFKIIFLLKSILLLYNDGAKLSGSNNGRSRLLKKILKKYLLYINNFQNDDYFLHLLNQLNHQVNFMEITNELIEIIQKDINFIKNAHR